MSEKSEQHDLDNFKEGLRASVRALSGKKDTELRFRSTETPYPPKLSERRYRTAPEVALIKTATLSSENKALARAQADSESLHLHYHNKKTHLSNLPAEDTAARLFDALEQARYEALGAKEYLGVKQNFADLNNFRCHKQGFENISTREDANAVEAIYTLAYHAFSGSKLPKNAQRLEAEWTPWLKAQLGEDGLKSLSELLSDQNNFALKSKAVLEKLGYLQAGDAGNADNSVDDGNGTDDADEGDADIDESDTQKDEGAHEGSESDEGNEDSQEEDYQSDQSESDTDEDTSAQSQDNGNIKQHYLVPDTDNQLKTSYQIYTTQFDEIVKAQDLADPYELARLRSLLDKQLTSMQSVVAKLANRLQRKLMAKQQRSWEFDLEEGVLDPARLARIVANPYVPLTFKQERETEFKDTVVTILLDNSGSMRGRPITISALCADILARTLERCQIKTEILGYTTRAWKGGQSRDVWVKNGRPINPGRLNDIRHIIYKSADQPWRRSRNNLALMLKEGLLKENIDGEALVWAYNRLAKRGEQRKIMIVISDGAPVDDSTLSVNPSHILEIDLKQVINWIEKRSDIQLAAIGIGHDVTRHYTKALKISDADDLGNALIEHLESLFTID